MSRLKIALLTLLLTPLLAFPASANPLIIKFSHVVAVDTPKGLATERFKAKLEEISNGNISVQIYPDASLFNDEQVMTPLMANVIQMAAPSFAKFTKFAPALQLVDLPFLFNDADHLHRVLDGPAGVKMLKSVSSRGLIGLEFWDNGFKHLSANTPIIRPQDAEGLKIRIMSSKVLEAQFKAVNASPQALPFPEVYSALKQRIVDASENPLSNFYTQQFYNVQSDLTLSAHGYLGYMVVTNRIFWRSLNKTQRQQIKIALAEATDYGNALALKMENSFLEKIKATGKTEIHHLSKQQRKEWQDKMIKIYPQFYNVIGKDLIMDALQTR